MKVLLMGASGFLGRNVLLRAPDHWETIGVYRNDETFPAFVRERLDGRVAPLRYTGDPEWFGGPLRQATGGAVDACVIAWGNTDIARSVEKPLEDLQANVIPVLHLLDAIDIGRLVFVSTGAVYLGSEGLVTETSPARPTIPYGVSKLAAELYIQSHVEHRNPGTKYVIARFFGAFGPYERPRKIYTRLVQAFAFRRERTFTIRGDGTNLIDAMVVNDAVTGLLLMVESQVDDVVVNFASGDPCSINDLVRRAGRVLGAADVEIVHEGTTKEPITFLADTSRMEELFGFTPETSFEQGIVALRDHLETFGAAAVKPGAGAAWS